MHSLKKEIWSYHIEIDRPDDLSSLEEWCESAFGRRFERWFSWNLSSTKRTYAFKDEGDLIVFKLRGK